MRPHAPPLASVSEAHAQSPSSAPVIYNDLQWTFFFHPLVVLLETTLMDPLDGRTNYQKTLKSPIASHRSGKPNFLAKSLKPFKSYTKTSQILQKNSLELKEQEPFIPKVWFLLKRGQFPSIFIWNPQPFEPYLYPISTGFLTIHKLSYILCLEYDHYKPRNQAKWRPNCFKISGQIQILFKN